MSLLEFTNLELLVAIGVLLAASVVRGYSGFGFSAVLVAGLSFIIDPVQAVPLAIVYEVLASVVQGRSIWTDIRWKDCVLLLGAAVIGNPIGVLLLTSLDQDFLRGATFLTLLALSLGLLFRQDRTAGLDPVPGLIFAVGIVAGIVNGATAMSGLVLVLAMSFTIIKPAAMRATLVAYFFASDIVAIGVLGVQEELTALLFWRALIGIPVMVVGVLAGSKLFTGASVESFRRATLGLLFAISLAGLIRLMVGG